MRDGQNGKTNMMLYVLFVLYIVCSALGLLLIKAGGQDLSLGVQQGVFHLNINLKMLLGMVFYVCSFLLFTFIVPKFDLTYIYPVAAGILYVVITVVGILFLKEKLTMWQVAGLVLILLGVVAINIKK